MTTAASTAADALRIGEHVFRSRLIVGTGKYASFAQVEESILMEHVEVGRYAKIRRAIIDKDVVIPRYAEIGYNLEEDRRRFHVTESGIVVVGKGTVIEESASPASMAGT